jgi:hypothetical protein
MLMPYTFMTLDEALRELPTLREALGKKWLERESATPMLESAFPLARSLRLRELSPLHSTLDRRLAELWNISGAHDWRKRLRHNGQELRELQTELAFASFLQKRGYDFTHPDNGPDFAIVIGDEPPLLIEATTPRVIMWDNDLDTRLWILSRQFGYSVRTEPLTDNMPILSEAVTERRVQQIVADAVELLSSPTRDESVSVQSYPDIGLKIEWIPSADPIFSGRNSPNSSHVRAFNYVWTAAENKAKQLKLVDAHTLLIGTNQLPASDWMPYVQSVRSRVPYFGDFDWTQIHPQIDHILLFGATYGDSRVPAVDVLTRPSAMSSMPVGLARLFDDLHLAGEDYRRQSEEDERELVAQLMDYEARHQRAEGDS